MKVRTHAGKAALVLAWVAATECARAHDPYGLEEPPQGLLRTPVSVSVSAPAPGHRPSQAADAPDDASATALPEGLRGDRVLMGPDPVDFSGLMSRTFSLFDNPVRHWWDATHFHVGGDGMPAHGLMEGITSWQRQVPVPTYYFGTNDWKLPRRPVPAAQPLAITTNRFLQGAIALAANGIPIFNPANKRGEISALIGELDRWGGHCGRADDYHYHAAPLHLTNVLGNGLPIAFALDGYPIYGLVEPDGSVPTGLDAFRGHEGSLGYYHYHASTSMPYVNGGFHGEIVELLLTNGLGQVVSQAGAQPRVNPVRPSGTALAGAALKVFTNPAPDRFELYYSLPANAPATNSWRYALQRASNLVSVTYLDAAGLRTTNYPNWRPAPPRASTAEPLVVASPVATHLAAGATLRLAITASGAPPLTFQWMRNGAPLADDARIQGALSSQLIVLNASESDAGEYSARVTNPLGATESARAPVQVGAGRSATLGRASTSIPNLLPSGTRVAAVGTVASADGRTWTLPAATAFATGLRASDLFNEVNEFTPAGIAAVDPAAVPVVEVDADGEVVTGYLYADNYFELYVNGTLVAVDPIPFTPFNSAIVRFKARRPITYAVRLVDWEENLGVGTELHGGNPNHPGDGGFVASFSDGTVTGPHWRAQAFYIAPLADPALVVERADGTRDSSSAGVAGLPPEQAWAVHYPVPAHWASQAFDDAGWPMARAYTEAQAGVGNQPAYTRFPAQFGASGAALIWSSNLVLDNEVLVRFTAPAPSNAPPAFLPSTHVLWARPGQPLRVALAASDPDQPAQALTFGLVSAPAGAAIHPITGLLEWTPSPAFAGTSNLLRVVVTDNGVPSRSATRDVVAMVRPSQPDVVVIVTDDHGWGDLGANGGPQVTPNLDRLGREGIRMGRFYVTPICSVTRSTLLTGRHPLRTGVNNGRGLALQEHVLPVAFRSAGYQTYVCGKWHLGGLYNTETNAFVAGALRPVIREGVEYQPQNRGWDVHYGEYTGAIGYQTHVSQETGQPDWWLNGQPITEAGWSTDLLADKAIELLRNRDPLRPVLLYLAFNAVHGPVSAPAELLAKHAAITDPKRRASVAALDQLDQLDQAVGRVLAAIDADGSRDRTLVTFFGDNGGQQSTGGSNLPLRGDKGDLFEGGIRTPAAIRWPGVLPEGVTNHQQAVWVGDLFPTLCAATGVVASTNVPFDGVNVWPLLLHAINGPFDPARHRASPLVTGSSAGNAVFEVGLNGTNTTLFKYIRQRLPASSGGGFAQWLFDIAADPLETTDLVALPAHAPRVAAMAARIDAITAESCTPYFGVHPEPARAPAGTNVVLWAMATAYNKSVAFQWRRNGVPIPGATNRVLVDASVYATQLALANVTPQDAGTYDVVVTASTVGWPAALASKGALLSIEASQPPPGTPLPYDVLVGRPTDRSITLSLLAKTHLTAWVETGIAPGVYTRTHPVAAAKAGEPASFVLEGLQPDTRHHYRVWHDAGAGAVPGTTSSFMTARARGSAFTFVVEADPHNRDNEPAVWRQALTNMLADAPDFLVDLGDTFMEEKVGITNAYYLTQPGIADLHREVREGFFSITGHALPTYLVNGNHEAELGWLLRILSITNNPAVWSAQARQRFFPVPVPAPGGVYSGSGSVDPSLRGPRDGYYAFEWGDALLVALDPFWYTNPKPGQGGWGWTLGEEQYRWLKATLEGSTARFRFVFLHHLVGGGLGNQSRGGLTYAPFFEWGGRNLDGSPGFATARPGWEAPIQDLLLRHGVQVVFHGHDHLFVKEELDANNDGVPDLIYQEVPQPSRALFGTNSAPAYGYTNRNSLVVGNSGHLRVRVTPGPGRDRVRARLPPRERDPRAHQPHGRPSLRRPRPCHPAPRRRLPLARHRPDQPPRRRGHGRRCRRHAPRPFLCRRRRRRGPGPGHGLGLAKGGRRGDDLATRPGLRRHQHARRGRARRLAAPHPRRDLHPPRLLPPEPRPQHVLLRITLRDGRRLLVDARRFGHRPHPRLGRQRRRRRRPQAHLRNPQRRGHPPVPRTPHSRPVAAAHRARCSLRIGRQWRCPRPHHGPLLDHRRRRVRHPLGRRHPACRGPHVRRVQRLAPPRHPRTAFHQRRIRRQSLPRPRCLPRGHARAILVFHHPEQSRHQRLVGGLRHRHRQPRTQDQRLSRPRRPRRHPRIRAHQHPARHRRRPRCRPATGRGLARSMERHRRRDAVRRAPPRPRLRAARGHVRPIHPPPPMAASRPHGNQPAPTTPSRPPRTQSNGP